MKLNLGKLNGLGRKLGIKRGERLALDIGLDSSPIPFTHAHLFKTKEKIIKSHGIRNHIKLRHIW